MGNGLAFPSRAVSVAALSLLLAALALAACGGGAGGGGNPDGGNPDGGTDGGTDGGPTEPPPRGTSPTNPQNALLDTDCDGLSDWEEYATVYPGGGTTDPAKADTDGDGIPDGVELGRTTVIEPARCALFFRPDADPSTTTNPLSTDSDGDGIPDGVEDANHDGARQASETDPSNPDTDGDGIPDGVEDANHDGIRQPSETDPRLRDTDGDGIPDGIEDVNRDGVRQPTETDPRLADTDGDGCSDGDEDKNWNHVVDPGETNPLLAGDCGGLADSDGDGIPDVYEDRNGNGIVDPGETDPNNPDTDGDGIPDGKEDKNWNGIVDAGETSPLRKDTDCDGLADGVEDANHNGVVDPGETDPSKADTDGDGLTDGVERRLTAAQIADPVNCPAVPVDADPSTGTDPLNPDTDGDGIMDGVEDANQNGRVDPGESNPNNAADPASATTRAACSTANLTPIAFDRSLLPDLQAATLPGAPTPPGFSEKQRFGLPAPEGTLERGFLFWDPTRKVAGFALKKLAADVQATASAEETFGRAKFAALGAISNPLTQTFTTWDGHPAVKATYQWAAAGDAKTLANDAVKAFIGSTAVGLWTGAAGATGPYFLQVEYVRRSAATGMVVAAFVPQSLYDANAAGEVFAVDDLANGSALGQYDATSAAQCNTFASGNNPPVDFLWIVDNSGSMGAHQNAVKNAGDAMAALLQNSMSDWRMGLVTTSYYVASATSEVRDFTTDPNRIKCWFDQACTGPGNWVTTSGSGNERGFQSARMALDPGGFFAGKVRPGAKLVLVVLTDTEEQSTGAGTTAADYRAYFASLGAQVSGIVCLGPGICSATELVSTKYIDVVNGMGGILASIQDFDLNLNTLATLDAIIRAAVGSASPYVLSKAPISASFRVALQGPTVGACGGQPAAGPVPSVPRSRQDGFDYYPPTNAVLFYGACRPAQAGRDIAVSYRYWIAGSCGPDGCPTGCPNGCPSGKVCGPGNTCICDAGCGGTCAANQRCDSGTCGCVCAPDCGGTCGPSETCNVATCACQCTQSATCGPGYVFDSTPGVCGCVCDPGWFTPANCAAPRAFAPAACACVCPVDCGGCQAGYTCNQSTCSCTFNG